MLKRVAQRLDEWVSEQNLEARAAGLPMEPRCTIKVFGQSALLESELPLVLATTRDVDVKADYSHAVQRRFEALLAEEGRELDPVAHEAWMPRETRYTPLFEGKWVRLLVADPEAVLVSKALKDPAKNEQLLVQYLALGPSPRFLQLAAKYQVDLESLL
jgi:hypothetical protein